MCNDRKYITHEYEIYCLKLCYIQKCNMPERMLHTKRWCPVSTLMLHTKICNVRTHVTHRNIVSRVRTYVTYKKCIVRSFVTNEYEMCSVETFVTSKMRYVRTYVTKWKYDVLSPIFCYYPCWRAPPLDGTSALARRRRGCPAWVVCNPSCNTTQTYLASLDNSWHS